MGYPLCAWLPCCCVPVVLRRGLCITASDSCRLLHCLCPPNLAVDLLSSVPHAPTDTVGIAYAELSRIVVVQHILSLLQPPSQSTVSLSFRPALLSLSSMPLLSLAISSTQRAIELLSEWSDIYPDKLYHLKCRLALLTNPSVQGFRLVYDTSACFLSDFELVRRMESYWHRDGELYSCQRLQEVWDVHFTISNYDEVTSSLCRPLQVSWLLKRCGHFVECLKALSREYAIESARYHHSNVTSVIRRIHAVIADGGRSSMRYSPGVSLDQLLAASPFCDTSMHTLSPSSLSVWWIVNKSKHFIETGTQCQH